MSGFRAYLAQTGTMEEGPHHLWQAPAFETRDLHLQSMDRAGIDVAILTHSSNAPVAMHATALATNKRGPEMIAAVNRALAEWGPGKGRFLASAWVDPRLGAAAVAEMERALMEDGARAFSLLAAYGGAGLPLRFLDHPEFRPVLRFAAQHKIPVFVHAGGRLPLSGIGEPVLEGLAATYLTGGLSMLLENTLCLVRLAVAGVFESLPNLTVVMGQLGGLFPFVLGRFDTIYDLVVAGAQAVSPESATAGNTRSVLKRLRDYTGRVYVDTHSMDQAAVLCAIDSLGPDRVLYGSDFPVTPAQVGRERGMQLIRSLPLDDTVKAAILGGTATRLFGLREEDGR